MKDAENLLVVVDGSLYAVWPTGRVWPRGLPPQYGYRTATAFGGVWWTSQEERLRLRLFPSTTPRFLEPEDASELEGRQCPQQRAQALDEWTVSAQRLQLETDGRHGYTWVCGALWMFDSTGVQPIVGRSGEPGAPSDAASGDTARLPNRGPFTMNAATGIAYLAVEGELWTVGPDNALRQLKISRRLPTIQGTVFWQGRLMVLAGNELFVVGL